MTYAIVAMNAQTVNYTRIDAQPVPLGAVVSPKNLDPGYAPHLKYLEAPSPSGNSAKAYLKQQKAISAERFPRKAPMNLEQRNAETPEILTSFIGNGTAQGTPLDNHLAVSNDGQIISVVNSHLGTKDELGEWIFGTLLTTFTSSLNLQTFIFDPRILYDPIEDKWIVFMMTGNSSDATGMVVGFSQSNDAEGDWNLYFLEGNPFNIDAWADFPMVALTEDEVFLTVNSVLDNEPWQTGFFETLIFQIDKYTGYDGASLEWEMWSEIEFEGKRIRNLCPVRTGMEPDGNSIYFLSNRNFDVENDSIFILELTGTQSDPNTELLIDVQKADLPYGVPPEAMQEEGSLSTNDARILDAFVINDQIQFVGNTVESNTGRASVYHGIISEVSGARTISGHIFNGPDEYGYPSISYVGTLPEDQDAILVFSHTSDMRDAGYSAVYFDNEGEYSDYLTVKEGSNSIDTDIITVGPERWGDYSGNQRVYNDPGIVWVASTYAKGSGQNETWIAQLAKPGYLSSDFEAPTSTTANEIQAFPNPTSNFIEIQFELATKEKLEISILDAQGKKVTTLINDVPKQSGLMQFSFDTKPLASGLYIIQVQSKSGIVATKKFVVE